MTGRHARRVKARHRLLTLAFVAAAIAGVFAKTQGLSSAWRQVDIEVDGNDAEWPGGAALLIDAPIAVGVTNDSEFLYLRVRTSDRVAGMQVLVGGLTIWFDSTGTTKKTFGIRYPLAARPPEAGSGQRDRGRQGRPDDGSLPAPASEPARGPGGGGPLMEPATMVAERLEVLGAKKDDIKAFPLGETPAGIKAGIARVENTLVLELRVPLAKFPDGPYGIGVDPGATITLGFETGTIERPKRPDGPGAGGMGGPGGGGRGGGMGGPGGGMGGPGGGGMGGPPGGRPDDEMSKTLKAWTRVRLATAP